MACMNVCIVDSKKIDAKSGAQQARTTKMTALLRTTKTVTKLGDTVSPNFIFISPQAQR